MRHPLLDNAERDRLSRDEWDEAMRSTRMIGCLVLATIVVLAALGLFLLWRAIS